MSSATWLLPVEGRFEAHSKEIALRDLSAAEPNWRWSIEADENQQFALACTRGDLSQSTLMSLRHSAFVEAMVRRTTRSTIILFIMAGEVEITDRRRQRYQVLTENLVASVAERSGQRITSKPGSAWLAFRVPHAVLRRHFEELTGSPYIQDFVLPPTSLMEAGVQSLFRVLCQAETEVGVPAVTRFVLADAYHHLALIKLLTKTPHNLTGGFDRGVLSYAPEPVLKAESFMREHLRERITIEKLARAAGRNSRTLQRLFRAYRGATPMAVLRNLRLSAAHLDIKADRVTTIAELAIGLRFGNPGHFSFLYKRAYGATPMKMLRRAQEAKERRL